MAYSPHGFVFRSPRPAPVMDAAATLLEAVCAERPSVDSATLEQVVTLAVELAREGREGRTVGTIFTVGDAETVLAWSQPMILDPLAGHSDDARRVDDPDARETLKELALLDGAFVVFDDGVAVSAARYLDADAVVVSTSAIVRIMDDGELVAEIIPELWILDRYSSHIEAPVLARSDEQVTVMSRVD